MDIISLYYFSELAKDLNMTHTAQRLFVTQQTLSNHVQRLENYCGTQLMHRKPSLSLTLAGELLLDFAKEVISKQENLRDELIDIKQEEVGILRFGASPMRMNACLPVILPQFSLRYPRVEVLLKSSHSPNLETLIRNGDLDFAIVHSSIPPSDDLSVKVLINEPVYLCVPDELLRHYYAEEADALKETAVNGADLAVFDRLPFCKLSSLLWPRISECFKEAKVTPHIYATGGDTLIGLSICSKGLAVSFATQTLLVSQKDNLPNTLNVFPLYSNGLPVKQSHSLVYRKDRYLTRYAKFFLELLFNCFSEFELMSPAKIV